MIRKVTINAVSVSLSPALLKSTAYYPEILGEAERFNQDIIGRFCHYVKLKHKRLGNLRPAFRVRVRCTNT